MSWLRIDNFGRVFVALSWMDAFFSFLQYVNPIKTVIEKQTNNAIVSNMSI